MDLKKKLKVIGIFGRSFPYILKLVLKKKEITNYLNDPYTIIFRNRD